MAPAHDHEDLIDLGMNNPPDEAHEPLSLETIEQYHEQLALFQRSSDLDGELEYLYSTMSSMRESFKSMFTDVTLSRLTTEYEQTHHTSPPIIDARPIVDALDLDHRPYEEWAISIEGALTKAFE
jgi:hypothetical protein